MFLSCWWGVTGINLLLLEPYFPDSCHLQKGDDPFGIFNSEEAMVQQLMYSASFRQERYPLHRSISTRDGSTMGLCSSKTAPDNDAAAAFAGALQNEDELHRVFNERGEKHKVKSAAIFYHSPKGKITNAF
jgi:hypothetical protein